jgi:hypothetical protein
VVEVVQRKDAAIGSQILIGLSTFHWLQMGASMVKKWSVAAELTEITLSHLDTQWGFRDNTPVEAGGEFAYAGILIEELCTSQSQHLNHSRGASIQTPDTI